MCGIDQHASSDPYPQPETVQAENENRAKEAKLKRYLYHRSRYLPEQLKATRRKLHMLRREAMRFGMRDLIEQDDTDAILMAKDERQM